jgi:hypothetical protein
MFDTSLRTQHRQTAPQPLRAFAVGRWRVWTALLTAITFVVLVSTAAMHHHATAVEDQECATCSVLTHKLADVPLVKLPTLILLLVSYAPYLLAAPVVAHISLSLLPPACGPPV